MSLNTNHSYGGMTELPKGTYGNFPSKVTIQEIVEQDDCFTPPPLLTKTQLLEQIGPDLYSRDPLWFLYDLTQYPCAQKFAAVSSLTSVFSGSIMYYASKFPLQKCGRSGLIMGAIAGVVSLSHCAKQHYDWWQESLEVRRQTRTKTSYGVPENIQRERDLEQFALLHPEIAEQQAAKKEEMRREQYHLRKKNEENEAQTAIKQLMGQYEQLKQ